MSNENDGPAASDDERTPEALAARPHDQAARPLAARPYAERRIVVIAPDEGAPHRARTAERPDASAPAPWQRLLALGALPAAGLLTAPALVSAAGLAWALDRDGATSAATARRLLREAGRVLPELRAQVGRAAQRALGAAASATGAPEEPPRDAGARAGLAQGTLVVPLGLARRELAFPPSHPQLDHAYAAHPLEAGRYLPLASFHRELFEEKCGELLTLLAALGARHVRAVCTQGYRSLHGAGASVDAPLEAIAAREGLSRERERVAAAVFEERYEPAPERAPAVPAGLRWFAHEPAWQALARRRIEFGARSLRAQLVYTDDFGVRAELRLGLEGLGVRAGGAAREFEATVWDVDVEFA